MELPSHPAMALLGIHLKKKTRKSDLKDAVHSYARFSVSHRGRDLEAAQVPAHGGVVEQLWHACTVQYGAAVKQRAIKTGSPRDPCAPRALQQYGQLPRIHPNDLSVH